MLCYTILYYNIPHHTTPYHTIINKLYHAILAFRNVRELSPQCRRACDDLGALPLPVLHVHDNPTVSEQQLHDLAQHATVKGMFRAAQEGPPGIGITY